jgi:hypothetical protein
MHRSVYKKADETNCYRNNSNQAKAFLDRSCGEWHRLGAIMSLDDMHMHVWFRRRSFGPAQVAAQSSRIACPRLSERATQYKYVLPLRTDGGNSSIQTRRTRRKDNSNRLGVSLTRAQYIGRPPPGLYSVASISSSISIVIIIIQQQQRLAHFCSWIFPPVGVERPRVGSADNCCLLNPVLLLNHHRPIVHEDDDDDDDDLGQLHLIVRRIGGDADHPKVCRSSMYSRFISAAGPESQGRRSGFSSPRRCGRVLSPRQQPASQQRTTRHRDASWHGSRLLLQRGNITQYW